LFCGDVGSSGGTSIIRGGKLLLTLAAPSPAPIRHELTPRTFLPEVQALRALAVSLVVLYHFWPARLQGGFVGVDVFFVISGFLITSHLHREVESHGRIRLAEFYARRARRLLPSALLVLLAAGAGTLVFLPVTRWATTANELLASALYGQNWLLAARAVDYSASQAGASPVQHFWSLSVEEQFYLLWPPLIMLLAVVSRRLARAGRDSLLLAGILVVCGASLAWSVHATGTDQAAAYFTTPTRIWELGAGAAMALWMRIREERRGVAPVSSPLLATAVRWAGTAAIVAAALNLSAASPFPGYRALVPVLGTVAVIAAGGAGRRDPLFQVAQLSPTQLLGNISYSLYLWHWPGIVLLPFVLHRAPEATVKVLLLAICLGLAWLSKEFVEDPARRWQVLVRPGLTAVAAAGSMLLVAGTSGLIVHQLHQGEAAAVLQLSTASADPCFGAAATGSHDAGCTDPFGPPKVVLPATEPPWFVQPGCTEDYRPPPMEPFLSCHFNRAPPTRTVAIVGDSHALHFGGAVFSIAKQLNWRVIVLTKGHCPATHARVLSFEGTVEDSEWVDGCRHWADLVDEELARWSPADVFTSGFTREMQFDGDPARSVETGAQGLLDVWTQWAARGMHVVVLRDVPSTGGVYIPDCLATNVGNPLACSQPRSTAVIRDALSVASERVASDRISTVDLTNLFCDENRCYGVIGGSIAYWDEDHLSPQFSRTLAPFLLEAISGDL
jgi:peptidoglycan/LPS O-acetylase OafA/YrhL